MKKILFLFVFIITIFITNCYASDLTNIRTEKIIRSINDFPAPVSGVITLENNVEYRIDGQIITSDRFQLPEYANIRIQTSGAINNYLVSTTTGDMFTGVNIVAFELHLVLQAPAGTLFNITGDATGSGYIYLDNCIIADTSALGDVDDISFFCITSILQNIGQGIELTDNSGIGISSCYFTGWKNATSTMVTIDGTQGTINVSSSLAFPNPNENILYIDPSHTNLAASFSANTFSELLGGSIFESGSLDQTSPILKFGGNSGLADSTVDAVGYFTDNTGVDTAIPAANVPVVINATWTEEDAERMTVNSDGRFSYIGLENIKLSAMASCIIEAQGGGDKVLNLYLGKIYCNPQENTFDHTTETVEDVAHGLTNGQQVRLSNSGGALPAELRSDIFYYVVNATTDDFQVSYTSGGAAVAFTDNGTGTHTYNVAELISISKATTTAAAGDPQQVLSPALKLMENGSCLAFLVENETDANDIWVYDANVIVQKG